MLCLDEAQLRLLAEIFAALSERRPAPALRLHLGQLLMRLLRADHYGSYVWSEQQQMFSERVAINLPDSFLRKYEEYYQFRDPVSSILRTRPEPTVLTQVMPQREFMRSEIYNDFARQEDAHWGMWLHVDVPGQGSSDLRFTRGKSQPDFGANEIALLTLIRPAFRAALSPPVVGRSSDAPSARPADPAIGLTPRESTIAHFVAEGLPDKAIAELVGISLTTVRTHLRQVFRKVQVTSRVQLARRLRPRA